MTGNVDIEEVNEQRALSDEPIDAIREFDRMESERDGLRREETSITLSILGSNKPLASQKDVVRTYDGPDGITTERHRDQIILGCGHSIEGLSTGVAGNCQSHLHASEEDALVCVECGLHRCDSCNILVCPRHLRVTPSNKYCHKCARWAGVKRFFKGVSSVFVSFGGDR